MYSMSVTFYPLNPIQQTTRKRIKSMRWTRLNTPQSSVSWPLPNGSVAFCSFVFAGVVLHVLNPVEGGWALFLGLKPAVIKLATTSLTRTESRSAESPAVTTRAPCVGLEPRLFFSVGELVGALRFTGQPDW